MATMHTAPVDDAGTGLAFIDSGPPTSNVYTTVVLVHGLCYNSRTFSRLLPLAASNNLRIIALNRRNYVGSTPFADSELALLFSNDAEDHKQFLRARGLEIARFLAWAIDELKLPPAETHNTGDITGGLMLVGWSMGSITTLAFLRYLTSFPSVLTNKLEAYLKAFIIYDSGYTTLGYPHPPGMYHPFRDIAIPEYERNAAFNVWISSYYMHPYYISPSASSEATRTLEYLVLRTPRPPSDLALTSSGDGLSKVVFKSASYGNIEAKAFATAIDLPPERFEFAFHGTVRPETLYGLFSGSLFFSSPYLASVSKPESTQLSQSESASNQDPVLLPNLRVMYLYGTQSPWTTQWSAWSLEKDIASHPEGIKRPVELARVEGANHFWHWDEPNAFVAKLAEISTAQTRPE